MKPAHPHLMKIPDNVLRDALEAFWQEYNRQFNGTRTPPSPDAWAKMEFAMRSAIAAFLRSWL